MMYQLSQDSTLPFRALRTFVPWLVIIVVACFAQPDTSSAEDTSSIQNPYAPLPVFDALNTDEWRRVDASVNRGLAWLARQQKPDGSFPTHVGGQPAVTAFATMAFLSRGHRPGAGPYGKHLEKAIDYVLAHQLPEGLFIVDSPNQPATNWYFGGHTGLYNHAITGLMLGEVYGMTDTKREEKISQAITKALVFARKMQRRPSPYAKDKYGWRYYTEMKDTTGGVGEADLSVTGWFVMFYRSARNAEFDVPEQYVTEALQFVRTCYDERSGGFVYGPYPTDRHIGRGMTGAGLLSLTVSGQRDEKIARSAGKWILEHPINRYNNAEGTRDRFIYGAYYCSQAMFVLGGDYWRRFYPTMANTLISNQQPAGHWKNDGNQDSIFGDAYITALTVLSLTPPYQLLPIYQR